MNKKITIQDLATSLAQSKGITKKAAESFIRTFFDTIVENLQKDKLVKIKGMGTFKLSDMEDRESVDVNTGERIVIKGYTKATFTPDATLRDEINKPFAQFETVILNENTVLKDTETVDENDQAQGQEEEMNAPEALASEEKQVASSETVVEETSDMDIVKEEAPERQEEVNGESAATTVDTAASDIQEEIQDTTESSVEKEEILAADETMAEVATVEETETVEESVKTEVEVKPSVEPDEVKKVDTSEQTAETPAEKKSRKGGAFFWILLLLFAAAGAAYYYWYTGGLNSEEAVPSTSEPSEIVVTQPEAIPADSLLADTAVVAENPQPVYPQMEGGEYEIIGVIRTHEIKSGETLRTIARDEYGSRDMSVYLIFFNKIENPDVVPVGMTIEIPELKLKQR